MHAKSPGRSQKNIRHVMKQLFFGDIEVDQQIPSMKINLDVSHDIFADTGKDDVY